MTPETAGIIIASIAAVGSVSAAVASGVHRRETRADHNDVGIKLDLIVENNERAHGQINSRLDHLVNRLDQHIDKE